MRILIINYTRIGDCVLSTALINHLIKQYPSSKISIVTSSISEGIFRKMPLLDKLFVVDKQKYSLHWYKIWKLVFPYKWDLTIDLRSSYLSYLIRTKRRKIFKGHEDTHKVEQLKKFYNIDNKILLSIWADEEDKTRGKKMVEGIGPLIAISPFSSFRHKDWPIKNYINLLNNDFFSNYRVVIVGISKDIQDNESFEELLKISNVKIINLIDKSDLRETSVIIDLCKLFIGSDSGLMHIATSTKCRTIGLFGPSNDQVYGPWGEKNVAIRGRSLFDLKEKLNMLNKSKKNIDLRYVGNTQSGENLKKSSLLDDITVEKVLNYIKENIP